MESTILFKGHASKTTATQQIFLRNGRSARSDCEEFDGKYRDRGINRGILASTKYSQNETYRNRNNEEEKIDIENVNNGSSAELERYEKESESSVNEDASSEEETSQINTGVYLLYDKKKEVQECVNNVLSYANEHGTLLSETQLKTILDIENVEITKDRANGLVQVISKCVDIVTNSHFVPPTTKKP
ncbi:unnamed protein product [Rotaria sordida]|uniref:Uncharacterized protein n=1 Tax=Rotaria sordida TaxID=392033 RepID=A0A815BLC0_9BILA|nr:unnamed protein product [Rotaria sordida]CAF4156967.1 unnamed protein product [Rotaria sordida]